MFDQEKLEESMVVHAGASPMRVRQMRIESSGVISVLLERAAVASWTPGAHVDMHLGSTTVRQYPLCGDPEDKTSYRVAVLHQTTGRGGSRYVHEKLRPGDLVSVSQPRNNFELLPAQRYVFTAEVG